MENVRQIIKRQNKQVSKKSERTMMPCNCKNENEFRINGNCRIENMAY